MLPYFSYIHELEQEVVALRAQIDNSRRHDTSSVVNSQYHHEDSALLEDAQMLTNLATAAASHHGMHHHEQAIQQSEHRHPASVSTGALHQSSQPFPIPLPSSTLAARIQGRESIARGHLVHRSDYPGEHMSRPFQGNPSQAGFNRDTCYAHGQPHPNRGTATASDDYGSGYQEGVINSSTARDMVDSVVSDIAFGGAIAASDLPRPVGHFMGASSGVSLARMVLDAVLRTGPAAGSPLPDRRDSVLEPAMSRPVTSPRTGPSIPHSRGPGFGEPLVLSTFNSPVTPHSGDDPIDGGATGTSLTGISTIDPALSSLHTTRTDYPTSHSRLRNQNLSYSDPPVGAFEVAMESPYIVNQRTVIDSPSPGMSYRQSDPVVGSPVPPRSIPALPPAAAVDRLVQVYVDFVQIMLPILHMPTFEKQLVRVREKSPNVQSSDIFFVLMVLGKSRDVRTFYVKRSFQPICPS